MKHQRLLCIAIAAILAIMAGGCSNFYLEQYHDSNSDYGSEHANRSSEQTIRGSDRSSNPPGNDFNTDRTKPSRLTARNANAHNNKRLFISEQAMYQLDKIQGIAAAVVVITDRNAYVGVITDQSSTGTYERGNASDVNNAGASEGVYDIYTRSPFADQNLVATDTNNLFTVPGNERMAKKLLSNIEVKIRKMHPHVQSVFISSNRDYVNALNSYALDYWNGKSLDRRLDDFNRMINEMQSKGIWD